VVDVASRLVGNRDDRERSGDGSGALARRQHTGARRLVGAFRDAEQVPRRRHEAQEGRPADHAFRLLLVRCALAGRIEAYLIQFTRTATYDPSHYIVREYDLRTNRLLPGKIADRTDDEKTMAGYAQTRTTSASGRWVYTLYQKPSGMPFIHALDTVAGVAHCIDLPWSKTNGGVYNLVLSLRNHDRTLAVHYRSGRPLLSVAVGSWQISEARSPFPWAWVGAGIGAGLAVLAAAGAVLLLRRRRSEEVEQRARHELGLA
jgi:hypothetical protein